MNDFVFQSPTRFVFGKGITDTVGQTLAEAGFKKALIVYGGSSVRRLGTLARVEDSLKAAGIDFVELGGVRPNPEVNSVRQGREIARAEKADVLLPVGGGSVIDCAKAIGFSSAYEGDPWDFFSGKAAPSECLPIACVLTIPAAGSEASGSCVISNDELGMKRGANGDCFRPAFAFMDPELTYTLPAYQAGAGITDMIAHICERFFSGTGTSRVTENIALGLINAIMDAAEKLKEDPKDYEARADIMWAGTLAHNDIAGCGLNAKPLSRAGGWESHGIEHELSALNPKITHGAGLAVMMPAWMRYVWRENPDRFLQFALGVFDIEPVDDSDEAIEDAVTVAIDELQSFFASLGMPTKLGELGITEGDIDVLVDRLAATKGETFGGFKKLNREYTRKIYESAF